MIARDARAQPAPDAAQAQHFAGQRGADARSRYAARHDGPLRFAQRGAGRLLSRFIAFAILAATKRNAGEISVTFDFAILQPAR